MAMVGACALLSCLPALATEPPEPKRHVDPALIWAIQAQESGHRPLAVNVEGVSFYPDTIEEAEAIADKAEAAGKSWDGGKSQLNAWWHRRGIIPRPDYFDPEKNTRWAKWILSEEIQRHGYNWIAVGKYHSPDIENGRRYAWLVYWQMNKAAKLQPAIVPRRAKEHADKTQTPESIRDTGTVRRNTKVSRQGRFINFDIHTPGLSRPADKKR